MCFGGAIRGGTCTIMVGVGVGVGVDGLRVISESHALLAGLSSHAILVILF